MSVFEKCERVREWEKSTRMFPAPSPGVELNPVSLLFAARPGDLSSDEIAAQAREIPQVLYLALELLPAVGLLVLFGQGGPVLDLVVFPVDLPLHPTRVIRRHRRSVDGLLERSRAGQQRVEE